MIDTREDHLATRGAATIVAFHETRWRPANSAAFAETEGAKVIAGPVFPAHAPALRLSPVRCEKRRVSSPEPPSSARDSATRAATCRGSATKISHAPVLDAPLGCDKNSTLSRPFFCRISGKIRPTPTPPATIPERPDDTER